jgi:hypothetical protein
MLLSRLALEGAHVADDNEVYAWEGLMKEAGVSTWLRRFHMVLWYLLLLLIIAAVGLTVVGTFVGGTLRQIGPPLLVSVVVLMVAATWHRRHLIAKVRWLTGTVTFRTVEPGGTGDDGQYVVCQVTVRPPTNITRVSTTVGPLDAQQLVAGATMRCLIDRNEGFKPLRVFPYARPDEALPSGRVLKFRKA